MSEKTIRAVLDWRIRLGWGEVEKLSAEAHTALGEALAIPSRQREEAKEQFLHGWQDMPEFLQMAEESDDGVDMPRGFLADLQEGLEHFGYELELDDRSAFPSVLRKGKQIEYRDHQGGAVEEILDWRQGIYKAPAGSGKTATILGAGRQLKTPKLIIVNTKEIMSQWIDRIHQFLSEDIEVGRVGGGKFKLGYEWTIATAQTLHSRYETLEAEGFFDRFGFVCVDECFPAGTLVGDQKIETLKVGNLVPSYDERTGRLVKKRVAAVMSSEPSAMVRLRFSNGKSVVCTPGHPFFTQRGWVKAIEVASEDEVLYAGSHEGYSLQSLRQVGEESDQRPEVQRFETRQARGVQPGMQIEEFQLNSVRHEQGLRLGTDEEKESNEARGRSRKSVQDSQEERARAANSWREWNGANSLREDSFRGHGATALRAANESAPREGRVANPLQDRPGRSVVEIGSGSGRRESQDGRACRAGQEERRLSDWVGLDSIEIYQPGSDGTFGGLCPDGLVYNIEVEDTHTYVAEGFVVHNCHHNTAESYRRAVNRFSARYRLGVSATPDKTGDFKLAQMVLGPVIHTTSYEGMVESGYLIQPEIVKVKTDFQFSFQGTTSRWQRSNYPQLIKDIVVDQERNALIVRSLIEESGNHCLLLTKRHEHIDVIQSMLLESGYKFPTARLTGKESGKERERVIKLIESEPCCVFSTIADEALDVPRVDRGFLVYPQSNLGLLTQQIGRFCRSHPAKSHTKIYDFADLNSGPLAAQWRKRMNSIYRQRKYTVSAPPWEQNA